MSYNYQAICASLLKDLPQRTVSVVERRFGLKNSKRETLEAIGQDNGITRERVRQIEEEGFSKIKPKLKNHNNVFQYFNRELVSVGGVQKEDSLLSFLGGKKYQNQVNFLLTLSEGSEKRPEDNDFHSFWRKDKKSEVLAKKVINSTINRLKKENNPLTLDQLFNIQKSALAKILGKNSSKNVLASCVEVSKKIQDNREGKIGLGEWVEINPRGIKDRAYLVLKNQGEPLHFSEVASSIGKLACFNKKKAHTATVHNELIKDSRFVLVGRGLYALTEWGYEPGVVKDIIKKVLKKSNKALTREMIVKEVSKQRIVKANTILLNLQDKSYFLKDGKGRYIIKES